MISDFNPVVFDFNPFSLLFWLETDKIAFEVINIYNRWAKQLTQLFSGLGIIKDEEEIYQYGFELLLSFISGCLSVLTISILFHRFAEGVVFLLVFIWLRMYTGGYHAKSHLTCNLCMMMVFFLYCIVATTKTIYTNLIFDILSWISLLTIYKYAPVQNVKKNLTDNERCVYRLKSRRISLMFKCLSILIVFFMNNIYFVITYALTIVGAMIIMPGRNSKCTKQ